MTRPQLAIVHDVSSISAPMPFSQLLADHHAILEGYLDTHVTRNHSDRTLESERRFLIGWFESFMKPDENHPDGERQLLIWEAMEPVLGRQRIVGFSKGLVDAGLKPRTVHAYL
ncbi:MAG: tyrosine-type recombinase/integrase, partial [Ktedonobacteraceae bacterium]